MSGSKWNKLNLIAQAIDLCLEYFQALFLRALPGVSSAVVTAKIARL
jgi:hypothetical protein